MVAISLELYNHLKSYSHDLWRLSLIRSILLGFMLVLATSKSMAQNDLMPETTFQGEVIEEPTWVLDTPEIITYDGSDVGKRADFASELQTLTLYGAGNQSVIFNCRVRLGDENFEPRFFIGIDLDKSKDPDSAYLAARAISARLTIGDNKSKGDRWLWNPKTDRIMPVKHAVGRRIFNAAVRGDQIQIKLQGKKRLDVTLPSINEDFRNFVKICPPLQPKKK